MGSWNRQKLDHQKDGVDILDGRRNLLCLTANNIASSSPKRRGSSFSVIALVFLGC